MTNHERKLQAAHVDRPLFVVGFLFAGLFLVGRVFAQEDLPAPISPSAAPVNSGQ